jgi:hypothetical protein
MYISDRANDSLGEEIIAKEMDKLYADSGFYIRRIDDRFEQIHGIDLVLIDQNKEELCIDEKAAIKYLTRDLSTYSFEVRYKNRLGWFVKSNMINDYYALIYPRSKTNDIYNLSSLECIIISKEAIHNIIGYNNKELLEITKQENVEKWKIFQSYNRRKRYLYLENGVKIVYSEDILPEQPINVIVPKDKLLENCKYRLYKEY